jgi:hypothetical protein
LNDPIVYLNARVGQFCKPVELAGKTSAWEDRNGTSCSFPRRLCREVPEQYTLKDFDGIGFFAGSAARSFKNAIHELPMLAVCRNVVNGKIRFQDRVN